MARMIKIDRSKERFTEIIRGFAEWLSKSKTFTTGKINFSTDIGNVDRKATVTFKSVAWLKMQYLVAVLPGEVGWHFVCRRSDDEDDEYIIDDVLLYPQEVSSATVNTDQAAYAVWEDGLEDEVFNNLRGHGHSHVNMGVTPSSTDLDHQDKRLDALGEDMFYLFCIYNKKGDCNWRIFDYKKNVMFETADVEVLVEGDDGIFDFMESIDEKVKTKTYTSYTSTKTKTANTTTATTSATTKASGGVQASPWQTDRSWEYDGWGIY